MTTTVNVRSTATPAVISGTAVARRDPQFDKALAGVGAGRVTLEVATYDAPTLMDGRPIVALDLGAGEVHAFLAESREREWTPQGLIERVSGRGVKAILDEAVVHPPLICDSNDIPVDELRFGFMHPEFSTLTWGYAASFGDFLDSPFDTPRPEGAADLTAEYISISTDPQAEGEWGARKSFTLSEGQYVVVQWTADDEFDLYINGALLIRGPRGPFKWEQKYEWAGWLCAGTYVLAVRVKNLDRASAGTNITYTWGSVMPAAGDGKPLAQNQLWHVDTLATSGTFTLTVVGYGTTPGLAYNISAANLQSALETLVGAGNVTVGGSGSPARNHQVEIHNSADAGTFQVGVDGQFTGNIAYNASAATVKAAIEQLPNVTTVTVTGSGTSASPWVVTVTNPQHTSFSFDTNDSLTAGGSPVTSSISTVYTGTEPEPWAIEFAGDLAYQRILLEGDGSTLTPADTLTVSEVTPAYAADAIVHTDTTWKVETFNALGHWKMTYGEVARLLLEQSQAQGELATVTRDGFGDDSDNAGAPWDTIEIAFRVGRSLLDCFAELEEHGVETEVTPELGLRAWQGRGTDLTATVTIAGTFVKVRGASNEKTTNRALLQTQAGWAYAEHPSLGAGDPRRTEHLAIGTAGSDTDTEVPVGAWLEEQYQPRRDMAYEWPAHAGSAGFDPLDDFDVGDQVTANGWDGAATPVRVIAIGQREDDKTGTHLWSVEAAVV